MDRERTQGLKIYDLDDGVWNIPELRLLLEKIVPEHGVMEGFQVERELPEARTPLDAAQCATGIL